MAEPIVVWRHTDGKAGHENQTAGLLAALRELVTLEEHRLDARTLHGTLPALLTGRFPAGRGLPDPDLHVGAGRATHLPILAARRARGGRSVVLMKPALPLRWFDLCVIPAHDRPHPGPRVLVTQGVLNRIRHGGAHDAHRGLLLVGGPSPHVSWSDAAVVAQIQEIARHGAGVQWTLGTSRRTPDTFVRMLQLSCPANVTVVPASATGPDWLPRELARAAQVWVSEDSVSMVYEALTSGASVGLLEVPFHNRQHRLACGVRELVQGRQVTHYADWRAGLVLQPPSAAFDEAARVARWIAEHWLAAA